MKIRTIPSLGLAGLIALAGCTGNVEAPKKEDYTKGQIVRIYMDGFSQNVQLWDVDGDRQVDIIEESGKMVVDYVAEGYRDKTNRPIYKSTKTMSPEMRETATRAFRAVQDLGFEIAKEKYGSVQEK